MSVSSGVRDLPRRTHNAIAYPHQLIYLSAKVPSVYRIIDNLAADLRRYFPDMTGLSPLDPKYMRAFGEARLDQAILQGALA